MTGSTSANRYLLDTNAFLFFINADRALSAASKELLESAATLLISTASLWEIAIKSSLGKLTLPSSFSEFIPSQLDENEIDILPITLLHIKELSRLPFHHKDPFDRLVIAQSISEKLPVVSSDSAFDLYEIERIW
ncbi:MAG TPA: type II toxin-antitoxin system VapC family toxin [Pyrinomonadaceae bacterium]|nr:type II toxin-antitoxin system VapC family toxin [Pyrinomonadaceae bacterium]